jgi:predicted transglutaminase-like cysteine proteinase
LPSVLPVSISQGSPKELELLEQPGRGEGLTPPENNAASPEPVKNAALVRDGEPNTSQAASPDSLAHQAPQQLALLEPGDLAPSHNEAAPPPPTSNVEDRAGAGEKAPALAGEAAPSRSRSASIAPSGQMTLPPVRPSLTPVVRIEFTTPALAPMAHTFFCLKYPTDCRVDKVVFRGGPVTLTTKRWEELTRVNTEVNRAIIPHPNTGGLAAEKWLIAPKAGECHDYAVTKRHELMALGWPERDLLLAEVITTWGEHHLVLVVRTSEGDLVADSLDPNIRSWTKVSYQWVRVETPSNPTFWSSVARTTVWVKNFGVIHGSS